MVARWASSDVWGVGAVRHMNTSTSNEDRKPRRMRMVDTRAHAYRAHESLLLVRGKT